MNFLTRMALRRPAVTLLAIALVLIAGVTAYRSLEVELFPQIEFPLVTVFAAYPSADPQAVARGVTAPIERAISGIDGLDSVQSSTTEGNAAVFALFKYGTDMADAEQQIEAAMSAVPLPSGAEEPVVGRFDPQEIPVIQIGIVSDRGLAEVQALVESLVIPELQGIEGVLRVELDGDTERNVRVTADLDAMAAHGVTLFQVSSALKENNLTLPAGVIFDGTQGIIAKTTHTLESLADIEDLTVGANEAGPVRLADVADVSFGSSRAKSIFRTNGKPGLGVNVSKQPDANTVDVTTAVNDTLANIDGLPSDIDIITVSDQGPAIQRQIDTLVREGLFGFLFAISVVFAFMLTVRPTIPKGLFNTLRPTIVIGCSIPLSVFTGILLMAWQDMTLNFMTLGGLAISVGRVVDDSIVVLENVYRHIQGGRERWRAALDATTEVGPAIFASTMTTVVVFVPLAFIEGLVGSFFLPFALTVTFALIASLLVALTAVPVLGALLLRPGDLPEGAGDEGEIPLQETVLQRTYLPILSWVLGHRTVTMLVAVLLTVSSLGLLSVIPVNLFGGGGDRFLLIELKTPPGTPLEQVVTQVDAIERRIAGVSAVYSTLIGATGLEVGGRPSTLEQASLFATLADDAPEEIAATLRDEFEEMAGSVRVSELANGPPAPGVEINVTGPNYDDIAAVTARLAASLATIDGIINLEDDVAQARTEVTIEVDPDKAAQIGLSTWLVALQLSQYLIGETVTAVTIEGERLDVVLSGDPRAAGGLDALRSFVVVGPLGAAPLGDLAEPVLQEGPVTISRTDGVRSASITGDIVGDDAQAIGVLVQAQIDALALPPGVAIDNGGVFADIAEGFQAIFISMGVGIVLVYLVMVASLGSLRNPFVIVLTLPLALVGALGALALTGRSLGLPAMMGILLLTGIVLTNGIVLIAFVEQQRARGMGVYDALISGARVRLRPILMTAITTSFALLPLAVETEGGGIISAELATVVIGGLMSSTGLTLLVLPIMYMLFNDTLPRLAGRVLRQRPAADSTPPPLPVPAPES